MSVRARRLDHVLVETPDIVATHARFRDAGYAEAWPIGPFWPNALTSGIRLAGFNLELYEPLTRPVDLTRSTLVFEPEDGPRDGWGDKWESDPALLRLRGVPMNELDRAHRLCRNWVPAPSPVDHFFCDYDSFFRARLAPVAPVLSPLVVRAPVQLPDLIVPEIQWEIGDWAVVWPEEITHLLRGPV